MTARRLKRHSGDRSESAAHQRSHVRARQGESVAPDRLRTWLIVLFGSIASLLAGIGIYGVISYSVAQRTHEIGVRAALGATRGRLMRLVMGRASVLTGLGLAVGLATAVASGRLLRTFLFGVTARDVVSLARPRSCWPRSRCSQLGFGATSGLGRPARRTQSSVSRFESPVNRVPVDDVPPSHGSVLSLNEPPTNPVRFNGVGLAYIAEDRAAPHLAAPWCASSRRGASLPRLSLSASAAEPLRRDISP